MLLGDKIDPNNYESYWQPFISLDKKILLKKLNAKLDPPGEIKFNITDGLVIAEGSSGAKWLDSAKKTKIDIPGISKIDFTQVSILEPEEYGQLINEIQSTYFIFNQGKYTISQNEKSAVKQLAKQLNKLNDLSVLLNKDLTLQILGRADNTGDEEYNLWLSSQRALAVKENLIDNGLEIKKIDLVGLGSNTDDKSLSDANTSDRNVSFKVVAD